MPINENFDGFPIDYFKLDPVDFIEPLGFENPELANAYTARELTLKTKDILTLDDDGYIRDSLEQQLNLEEINTTVVNCAVGQGKTSSLLRIIKDYSQQHHDVYFVFAVPFVSLISQYERDLIRLGVDESEIFNYEKIGKSDEEGGLDYMNLRKRFHIVTINTLLGNPGETAPLQSEAKHNYIKDFSQLLEVNNKKSIFIYDEIHDGIKNFSKIGEAHLWYFARSIRKNVILSATYNVQSIEVIKMLIKLTDNKLQILESERRVCRQQSQLYLHFDTIYSSRNLGSMTEVVRRLVGDGKNIDILSYSKKLCKKIQENDNPLGNILRERFGDLRDCTSNLEANQVTDDEDPGVNRYDNEYCNIGTNFKSGVSIEKENHAFIIILPTDSGTPYGALNGIFSDGVNSVIQAVARQRNPGEIHIFLRPPLWMNADYFIGMTQEQKAVLNSAIQGVGKNPASIQVRNNITIPRVQYIPFSQHITLVREKWSTQIRRLLIPYSYNMNLELPALDNYIMSESEKVLTLQYFLGKNIASFVTYSAFTNQFYNARLAGFNIPFGTADTGIDDEELQSFFEEKLSLLLTDESWVDSSIKDKYSRMRNLVMQNLSASVNDYQKSAIKYKIIEFLLLRYDNRLGETVKPSLRYLNLQYNNGQGNSQVEAKLSYYVRKVLNTIETSEEGNIRFFKPYSALNIFEEEKEDLWQFIVDIKQQNPALRLNLMNFFRTATQDNIGKRFYEYIRDAGFETEEYRPRVNGRQQNFKKIVQSFLSTNL